MNPIELGAIIRSRRKQIGLKQQQLADESGVCCAVVSEIENGKKTAQVGLVLNLLDALGLDLTVTERS